MEHQHIMGNKSGFGHGMVCIFAFTDFSLVFLLCEMNVEQLFFLCLFVCPTVLKLFLNVKKIQGGGGSCHTIWA